MYEVLDMILADPTSYGNIYRLEIEGHKDYTDRLFKINTLPNLTELHLYTPYDFQNAFDYEKTITQLLSVNK